MRPLIPTHLPKVIEQSKLINVKYNAEYSTKSGLSPMSDTGICSLGRQHHPNYRDPTQNTRHPITFVFRINNEYLFV